MQAICSNHMILHTQDIMLSLAAFIDPVFLYGVHSAVTFPACFIQLQQWHCNSVMLPGKYSLSSPHNLLWPAQ